MWQRIEVVGALLGLMWISQARADLIIDVGSASIPQGGQGSFQVWARSTTGSDSLGMFSLKLLIQPVGVNPNVAVFVNPQSPGYTSDPNYVFPSDSFGPMLILGNTATPDDTLTAGDFPASAPDYPVSTTGSLLGSFLVRTDTLLPPQPGNQFSITLLDDPETFFVNREGPVFYSSTPGQIDINAIPEPGTWLLLAAGSVMLGTLRIVRRKRPAR